MYLHLPTIMLYQDPDISFRAGGLMRNKTCLLNFQLKGKSCFSVTESLIWNSVIIRRISLVLY